MKNIKKFEEFNSVNEMEYTGHYDPTGRLAPKQKLKFPILYGFLTQELVDRLRSKGQNVIAVFQDGYIFKCNTPEKLKEVREKYKTGNTYLGGTITQTGEMSESNYSN